MQDHRNLAGLTIAALLLVGGCVLPPRGEPPVASTTTTTTAPPLEPGDACTPSSGATALAATAAVSDESIGDTQSDAQVVTVPRVLTGTVVDFDLDYWTFELAATSKVTFRYTVGTTAQIAGHLGDGTSSVGTVEPAAQCVVLAAGTYYVSTISEDEEAHDYGILIEPVAL